MVSLVKTIPEGKWFSKMLIFILIFCSLVLVFFPALSLLIEKWLSVEDYAHAFFIVPFIGYMSWQRRTYFQNNNSAPVAGSTLLILSLLAYLFFLKLQVPTLIFLSTASSLISIMIFFAGFSAVKEMAIPILLLFLIIPIPNQILAMLTGSLQLRISEVSELIIRIFGVPMYREGNMLHVQQMTFQVVEACSGMRSLISMTTFSVIVSYFTLTKLWTAAFLLLFSIPVALFINLTRVVTMVLFYNYFSMDLTIGLPHTITGLVLFILGIILLFSFQRVLKNWEK